MSSLARYNMPIRDIELNLMQAAAIIANTRKKIKNIVIKAARGAGKSTVLGWFVK